MSNKKMKPIFISNYGEELEFGFPHFKTPFNHNTTAEAERTGTECKEPTKTQQHQAEEADINVIMKRFGVTGQLPQLRMPPLMEEFTEIFDFQSAMNVMLKAKAAFAELPPEVRASFANDPHQYVAYVDAAVQAGDLDQLRAWGLALPAKPETPPETPKTDTKDGVS